MKFAVSSLSMTGYSAKDIKKIDPQLGIEIFYEWGSASSWEHLLKEATQGREGGFSIHSPFCLVDIAQDNKRDLYDSLCEPFDLYHRYGGEFYVVHSQGEHVPQLDNPVERYDMQMRVKDRLAEFAEICRVNGVRMVVENLFSVPGEPLYTQEEYLHLFDELPKIDCLIDIGHAILGQYSVGDIQKALKNRLVGYHIHDNDGSFDRHWRIATGVFGWKQFMRDVDTYTPDATLVMEYNRANPEDYLVDREKLLSLR